MANGLMRARGVRPMGMSRLGMGERREMEEDGQEVCVTYIPAVPTSVYSESGHKASANEVEVRSQLRVGGRAPIEEMKEKDRRAMERHGHRSRSPSARMHKQLCRSCMLDDSSSPPRKLRFPPQPSIEPRIEPSSPGSTGPLSHDLPTNDPSSPLTLVLIPSPPHVPFTRRTPRRPQRERERRACTARVAQNCAEQRRVPFRVPERVRCEGDVGGGKQRERVRAPGVRDDGVVGARVVARCVLAKRVDQHRVGKVAGDDVDVWVTRTLGRPARAPSSIKRGGRGVSSGKIIAFAGRFSFAM
ncbi:hypothetical protein F5148DRAFT_1151710 [Russula earlei]|uniref:Uncharacterized protein n=1 Tax=Russula earlei TaxID=71964 RepID=A0ACC0TZ87_9AGAM|nr:hypothetical protein F5148DRAFT_1151710 [Russula earlei]